MSATDTALSILRWTVGDGGPAPQGDLVGLGELVAPAPSVRAALGAAASAATARLRLDPPDPLDPAGPAGLTSADGVLAAAAVGGRGQPELAERVLEAAATPRTLPDLLAMHAVAAPALRALGAPPAAASGVFPARPARPPGAPGTVAMSARLRDLLVARSPLTRLLDHPVGVGEPGAEGDPGCEDTLELLLDRPDGRRIVTAVLAAPPTSAAQARWRGDLLDARRIRDPRFVLDVYEFALLAHREEHLDLIAAAERGLRAPLPQARDAHALAAYWNAMAAIDRDHARRTGRARGSRPGGAAGRVSPTDLGRRRHLPIDYRAGVRLVGRARAIRAAHRRMAPR